jgi:hypothetical protein
MSYNTTDNTMRGDQAFRVDDPESDSQTIATGVGEDIGYEASTPLYPLAPEAAAGYLLANAGDDLVKLISRTTYEKYVGVSKTAGRPGEVVTNKLRGVVWLPVGAVPIAAGEYVQATAAILDGAAADKAYDGDIIPAFAKKQVIFAIDATVDGTEYTLPGGVEVLKIVSGDFFIGGLAAGDSVHQALTVVKDGFSGAYGAGDVGANEIALINATQGVYATGIAVGSAFTDGIFVLECWVKGPTDWMVGQALHSGTARVSATDFDLIPVKLRGY